MRRLRELSNLGRLLAGKYDVMITNPPYRAISTMEEAVSVYAGDNYPNSKTDMFAMFMETGFVKRNGFMAMVNMHNWMTISSYEDLRNSFILNNEIVVMAHLGAHAFETIGGEIVQTTAFVSRKGTYDANGVYYNLVDSSDKEKDFFLVKDGEPTKDSLRFEVPSSNFKELPGSPYAYWISSALAKDFEKGENITKYIDTFQGIITGNNPKYLRLWHEVSAAKIPFHQSKMSDIDLSEQYWIPYNKGGEIRKWYGVQDYVVYWKNGPDDKTRGKKGFSDYYLKEYVAWSYTVSNTIATRYYPCGFLWDVRGSGIFDKGNMLYYLEALISSKIGIKLLRINNSTPSCQVENIIQFPIIVDKNQKSRVDEIVIENNNISRDDWDSFEVSWDFKMHPLILSAKDKEDALTTQFAKSRMEKLGLISWHYDRWTENCQARFDTLRRNEEELNRIFIGIYGLQQELTPEVDTGKLMNKNLTSQSRRHITIIEDDKALNDGIVLALKNTEFTFTQNYSLGEFCAGDPTDLIILDVNLPDGSGFDFLREYREVSDTPVIILTAKDLETDEVTGLTLGADDYITKPFSLMVLRARIDKVLQKRQMFSGNSYSDDEYSFDFDMKSSRVMVDRISDLPASLRMGLYKSIKMLSKEFISFSVEHL